MRTSHTNGRRTFQIIPLQVFAATAPGERHYQRIHARTLLAIWQHLHEGLRKFHKGPGEMPFWWLQDTTPTGMQRTYRLDGWHLEEQIGKHINAFFNRVLGKQMSAEFNLFTASLGIKPHALHEPMHIACREPSALPAWIRHCEGIRMKTPGPNESHPEAVWTQGATLLLCQGKRKRSYWSLRIEYGYRDDSSTWCLNWDQQPTESFEAMFKRAWNEFSDRVDWGERKPMPWHLENFARDERKRQKLIEALGIVFFPENSKAARTPYGFESKIATALMAQDGGGIHEHKIGITTAQLGTLLKWADKTNTERIERQKYP